MNDDDKVASGASEDSQDKDNQDPTGTDSVQSHPLEIVDPAQPGDQMADLHALGARAAAERIRVARAPSFRLTTRQAAKYIGVCKRTLENWRKRKIGPPHVDTGWHIWYELPALNRWIAGQTPGRYGPPGSPPVLAGAEATPDQPAIGNLTRDEAARYLGICVRTLDYWRGQPGKPQPIKDIKRVRYSIAELDAWLKAHTHGA